MLALVLKILKWLGYRNEPSVLYHVKVHRVRFQTIPINFIRFDHIVLYQLTFLLSLVYGQTEQDGMTEYTNHIFRWTWVTWRWTECMMKTSPKRISNRRPRYDAFNEHAKVCKLIYRNNGTCCSQFSEIQSIFVCGNNLTQRNFSKKTSPSHTNIVVI